MLAASGTNVEPVPVAQLNLVVYGQSPIWLACCQVCCVHLHAPLHASEFLCMSWQEYARLFFEASKRQLLRGEDRDFVK